MQTGCVLGRITTPQLRASVPETSDEALIGLIADGDKRAMQVLYGRHNVRVYRFIVRLTGNTSLAEDLVSEVFLDVWRQADGFEAKCQVSTWLLAIATAVGVRDSGSRPPLGLVAFSPYSDLAVTGASVESNAQSCAMFTPRGVREAAAMYLAGAHAQDPRASPLYADLTGLPPMLLFASRHEILRDDTLRLAERASAAGVKVELVVRDRLPHVWPVFVTLLPEARDAFATVTAFARQIGARNAA